MKLAQLFFRNYTIHYLHRKPKFRGCAANSQQGHDTFTSQVYRINSSFKGLLKSLKCPSLFRLVIFPSSPRIYIYWSVSKNLRASGMDEDIFRWQEMVRPDEFGAQFMKAKVPSCYVCLYISRTDWQCGVHRDHVIYILFWAYVKFYDCAVRISNFTHIVVLWAVIPYSLADGYQFLLLLFNVFQSKNLQISWPSYKLFARGVVLLSGI